MMRAFFKWLFTDPDKARELRNPPKPEPVVYDDYKDYDGDYGVNSIFGMG